MKVKSRKLYVWLISLGAVFVIYLLYNQMSKTPSIEIDTEAEYADTVADGNVVKFDSEIGMVGGVGVGTVRKAKYTHLNAEKQVDREFGFERLLHVEGDEWEIEKPYMNIFRHNLKCYMTAEEGKVRVEDAVGRATPRDATLKGNVVIHILPEKGSNVEESFIYLDDVIFISEKSQFSTDGPVKFTSQNAQMLGRGMELVYNEEKDCLEFLKIIDLETLNIRQSSLAPPSSDARGGKGKASLFSSHKSNIESPVGSGSQTRTGQQRATGIPKMDRGAIEKGKGEYYRCVFRNNVVIDCPEQLIFADEVSINNILWSKGPGKKSGGETHLVKHEASDEVREIKDEGRGMTDDRQEGRDEEFTDIVVTCDGGIIILPMDSSKKSGNTASTGSKGSESLNDESGRPIFVAQRIDYCLVTEDTIASGPSELMFYVNDVITEDRPHPSNEGEGKQATVPVKVTAKEKAKFLPALNQVVFEGDASCTMLRTDADIQRKYVLSGPKLTVDLFEDERLRADIKHLSASGGGVRLATVKTTGPTLVGGVELKCVKFDYDTGEQLFLATGPAGVVKVDNSGITEPKSRADRKFSLQKQCYAVVRNFDTLKYYSETSQVVADAAGEGIFVDYFPAVKGKYERQVAVTANHIEAFLYETASGQTEISTLSATGGITYEEEGKRNIWGRKKDIQFVGSEMFYDAGESIITAMGDESQPCLFNGALVDGIKYDLESGKIKSKVTGPGIMQMGR